MEARIFKVESGYSLEDGEIPEDFDYESQLTIRHQGSDMESEEIALKVNGIKGAQVVQLKPLEGGGVGADLVEYIFIGLSVFIQLSLVSLVGELGKEGIKKVISVLARRPEKTVLNISFNNRKRTLNILLPKNLDEKDVGIVFELAEKFVSVQEKQEERKDLVYDPKHKDLVDIT